MFTKTLLDPAVEPLFTGIRAVLYGDPDYPHHLLSAAHPPLRLWYKGRLQPSDRVSVAVVGSRRATPEGVRRSHRLAAELSRAGVTIVSGLAKGIDGAAHRGALAVGGRTIAVLGTGLNEIYPYEHHELFGQVIESGAAFSQFDPGFTGYRGGRNFLQRNHTLVGMSQLLVVIEASQRSGSLSAVRIALELGRPVGILRSLVTSQPWASELVESGRAFEVGDTGDVLSRLEL